jgi:heptosyltransferase-3
MTVLEKLAEGSRVAVIRLRSLGDCVLTTPAIALLHDFRPDLQISVSVEDRFRAVFEGSPRITQILPPNGMVVRKWRSDLCINLHGGTRSQWMTALSGARWRAGFAHHSFTSAYNIKIPRAQRILGVNRTVHTAEHLASALFALGVPTQDVPPAELHAQASPLPGRYAVLHAFASEPGKQWPGERFSEVARYLSLWNIEPVFLAGPDDNADQFRTHKVFSGTLADAKAVISGASLFLGNDSGPAHIAAAFGIPSVVLFGTSNPAIWSPWRTESEIIVAPDGIAQVSVSRVIAALERLTKFEEAHA